MPNEIHFIAFILQKIVKYALKNVKDNMLSKNKLKTKICTKMYS